LDEINNYRERLKLHNRNAEALPRIIDSMVKNKFIEAGIYPVKTDYERIGYYHYSDVNTQLELTWLTFLNYGRNIESFVRNYNFNGLEFSEYENYLKLGGFVIGRGNDEKRTRMTQVLTEIPRNRFILNAIIDLMNSKIDLDCRKDRIRNMARPFSQSILDREYRTLSDCCPTQDNSIWNFG
jgi:hypothetical protein